MSLEVRSIGAALRRAIARWGRDVPRSVWLVSFVQTVFLVALAATDGYDAARSGEAFRVVLTYAVLGAVFGLLHLLFEGRSRASFAVTLFVYAIFVGLNFARFETAGAFDYAFFYENVRELMTPLGRHIVGSQVKPIELFFFLFVPLALGALLVVRPPPEPRGTRRGRRIAGLACASVLVAVPVLGMTTHENLTTFATAAVRFHVTQREAEAASEGDAYPLVHRFVPSAEARALSKEPSPRPHVVLLFLESWSGIWQDRRRPNGSFVTPVFDERRRQGLTFDHFYGNSIQSSRGRFSTLCSLIPLYRGKEFADLADTRLHCLPHFLRDAGYSTVIRSAADTPQFERSEDFFRQLGFEEIFFESPESRGRDPAFWGTGLQDDHFYRKFFAALDAQLERDPGKPIFAVGINASHHYPFREGPNHVPAAEFPTRYGRDYVGSLSEQDAWLTVFFEELEKRPAFRDGIVILVGDHSFPADEHGVHFNGLGSYEESFRTGFALYWRGHVAPNVVTDRTASQIDLAPTIADLLQIEGPVTFAGRSLVAKDDGLTPSPMVQPYDGVRLVAVRYPYKLEYHLAADQEHLFDLASDPDERDDRIGDPALRPELERLRTTIARIRRSQAILRSGRVWPE